MSFSPLITIYPNNRKNKTQLRHKHADWDLGNEENPKNLVKHAWLVVANNVKGRPKQNLGSKWKKKNA